MPFIIRTHDEIKRYSDKQRVSAIQYFAEKMEAGERVALEWRKDWVTELKEIKDQAIDVLNEAESDGASQTTCSDMDELGTRLLQLIDQVFTLGTHFS